MSWRRLATPLSILFILSIFVYWLYVYGGGWAPDWALEVNDDGERTPRVEAMFPTTVVAILASQAALISVDPGVFRLRDSDAVSHQALVDIYEASIRQWKILEKLEYAHTLGCLPDGKYHQMHSYIAPLIDDLDEKVKEVIRTRSPFIKHMRIAYYTKIKDPITKMDLHHKKINKALVAQGVDPDDPNHSWNREYQNPADDPVNRPPSGQ